MLTGWPRVYHLAMPRAVTIMPSVAMKGGMPVVAIRLPLTVPAAAPTIRPAATGTSTGRPVSDGIDGTGKVRLLRQAGRDHRRQPDHRAGRQVDAAGDDHLGHADGDDADHRDLQDHHRQALRVEQEALADEDPAEDLEDQRDAEQDQQDADFRRPARCAGRRPERRSGLG